MKELLVISASRRTDLVGCYPEKLIKGLEEYPPEKVHSVVVWTKNPRNLIIKGALAENIQKYRQIYIHLTITGMGGGEFEPRIPPWPEIVRMIEPLIQLVGDPRRLSWRFDPILNAEKDRRQYSNFDLFPVLTEAMAQFKIPTCRVSWVSPYKKVIARLGAKGWRLIPPTLEERREMAAQMTQIAGRRGMNLHFCSMEGLPVSRCIDGKLLSSLHPDGLRCSPEKAKGQRLLCGCTQSFDIGWYSLKCRHGCLYCYANP